jgi:hypothetical protein
MSINSIAENFIRDIKSCVSKYENKRQSAEFSTLESSLALRVSAVTITILSAIALSGAAAAFVAGSAGFIPLAAVSGLGFIAGHDLATVGNNLSAQLNPTKNKVHLLSMSVSDGVFYGTIIKKDFYDQLEKSIKRLID